MSRALHWCFTLNNYTDDDQFKLRELGDAIPNNGVVYLVFGRETGSQNTPHLQGYISFRDRKRLAQVKSAVSSRAHFEVARGSPEENRAYCTKDGDFEEFGTLPAPRGNRSDLVSVASAIREGKSIRAISESDPSSVLRYGSGLLRLRQFYRPVRSGPPQIWVFWGPPGSGKTRRVHEFANHEELWIHSGMGCWFDGYDSQLSVLFDDFDGSWFSLTFLLKLLDRYVFPVPVKGGFTWWNPKNIYITSNIDPNEWYPNAKQVHVAALKRRLREFGSISFCE